MTENAQKAAESIVDWLLKEGLLDESDPILKRDVLVSWIRGIIDDQYGSSDIVPTVTIDEIEEKDFHDFNERLRFDW